MKKIWLLTILLAFSQGAFAFGVGTSPFLQGFNSEHIAKERDANNKAYQQLMDSQSKLLDSQTKLNSEVADLKREQKSMLKKQNQLERQLSSHKH